MSLCHCVACVAVSHCRSSNFQEVHFWGSSIDSIDGRRSIDSSDGDVQSIQARKVQSIQSTVDVQSIQATRDEVQSIQARRSSIDSSEEVQSIQATVEVRSIQATETFNRFNRLQSLCRCVAVSLVSLVSLCLIVALPISKKFISGEVQSIQSTVEVRSIQATETFNRFNRG